MRRDFLFASLCTTWAALLAILLLVCMDTYLLHYFRHGKYALCGVLGYFAYTNQETPSNLKRPDRNYLSVLEKFENVVISYDNFNLKEPLFIDQEDRRAFLMQSDNLGILGWQNETRLLGRIMTHRNGTVHTSHDCGWTTRLGEFLRPIPRRRKARETYELLCPLLVPNSNTFQHFVDGVLPKLAQIHQLVTHRQINVTYLFYRPWDRIIPEMLARMGIHEGRVRFYDGGYLSAHYLINTCVTPPLHPILWKRSRELLGVTPHQSSETLVVLLTRHRSRNVGRNILNMGDITGFLRHKYGSRLHVFEGAQSLDKSMLLFSKAAIVIGVHGGAFYNLIFCPQSTKVIEVVPSNSKGSFVPKHLAHTIIWQMSHIMNQTYLRMSLTSTNDRGDVHLPVVRLQRALRIVEGG